jgi:hypothetical protein
MAIGSRGERLESREGTRLAAKNVAAMYRKLGDPQREVDEEISHIRGLVLIRMMLAERGTPASELRDCDAVIAECRLRLADLAIRAGAYASAA